MTYNRYSGFISGDVIKNMPFIKLPSKASDKTVEYRRGFDRMDKFSDKYYKNPNYGWLIMLANPTLGNLEFEIEDMELITIPFPLETSLADFENAKNKYIKYYGV